MLLVLGHLGPIVGDLSATGVQLVVELLDLGLVVLGQVVAHLLGFLLAHALQLLLVSLHGGALPGEEDARLDASLVVGVRQLGGERVVRVLHALQLPVHHRLLQAVLLAELLERLGQLLDALVLGERLALVQAHALAHHVQLALQLLYLGCLSVLHLHFCIPSITLLLEFHKEDAETDLSFSSMSCRCCSCKMSKRDFSNSDCVSNEEKTNIHEQKQRR